MKQMQGIDRDIRKALWKIRLRIEKVQFVTYLLYGMIAGLVAGIVVLLLAFVIPVYAASWIAGGLVLFGSLLGCIISLIRFPGIRRAAYAADQAGLKERMQTAIELTGEESDMAVLAKKDALYRVRKVDVKEMVRFRMPGYIWLTILFLAVCGVSAALLPSPVKEEANVRHELAEKKEKEKAELSEAKKKLEKQVEDGTIDAGTAEELEAILNQAMKEVDRAESASELEKAENRMKTKVSMAAADAAKAGNPQKTESLISAAKEMGLLSSQEAEQIKTTQLAQNSGQSSQADSGGNGESQGVMEGGGNNSQSGENGGNSENGQSGQGGQSGQSGDGQSGQNGDGQSGQDGNGQSGQNGNGQSGQNGNGQGGQNGSGQSGQNGNGQGGQNGKGQSGQNGNGQGGSGNGSGWNTGSKNGVKTNENLMEKPEEVVVGTQGTDGNLTGQSGSGSSKKQQSQNGLSWDGKKVSYDQVLSSYQQKAYSKISQNKVPAGMKNIVQSYFDGIGK